MRVRYVLVNNTDDHHKNFTFIATKHGVSEQWTGRVETAIIGHLKTWGEGQKRQT